MFQHFNVKTYKHIILYYITTFNTATSLVTQQKAQNVQKQIFFIDKTSIYDQYLIYILHFLLSRCKYN